VRIHQNYNRSLKNDAIAFALELFEVIKLANFVTMRVVDVLSFPIDVRLNAEHSYWIASPICLLEGSRLQALCVTSGL
jgi:hypothetical protein